MENIPEMRCKSFGALNMNSPLGIEARLLGTPPGSPGGLWGASPPCTGFSALCCFCSQLHSLASPFGHLESDPKKILIRLAHTHCWEQGHRNGAVKAGLRCWPCLLLCHDGPATKTPWILSFLKRKRRCTLVPGSHPERRLDALKNSKRGIMTFYYWGKKKRERERKM